MKNTDKMKRGLRNNNPLNIRRTAERWQGTATTQTDPEFVQFETMDYGYRAAWKLLDTYYHRLTNAGKHFTVENIIGRWAPPGENDTKAYVRSVLLMSSIGGQENLLPPANVEGYLRLNRLLAAMTCMECGVRMQEVDKEAIWRGYLKAFPQNRVALEEWIRGQDEYADW